MDTNVLEEALYYLHVEELKDILERLNLPTSGKKGEIILRILTFVKEGVITKKPAIPKASQAQAGTSYPLHPKTLILHGSYKNDAVTRQFMKTLIGEHFHFTAFGQDWIKERWLKAKPPTYADFAAFWQKEWDARKKRKKMPKQEWVFLNFIQRYMKEYPKAPQKEMTKAWEKERKAQVEKAYRIIQKL